MHNYSLFYKAIIVLCITINVTAANRDNQTKLTHQEVDALISISNQIRRTKKSASHLIKKFSAAPHIMHGIQDANQTAREHLRDHHKDFHHCMEKLIDNALIADISVADTKTAITTINKIRSKRS